MSTTVEHSAKPRQAFRDGFLAGDLDDLDAVRLVGSRCGDCGIALFGVRHRCENCASTKVTREVFSPQGRVYTYTIQRYAPPPPNALSGPWSPRPLAWIDIENGPRILGVVDCAVEAIEIGMPVRLTCEVGWRDGEGHEVVSYKFIPANTARER